MLDSWSYTVPRYVVYNKILGDCKENFRNRWLVNSVLHSCPLYPPRLLCVFFRFNTWNIWR